MFPCLFEISTFPGLNEEGPLNILPVINFMHHKSKNDVGDMDCIEIYEPGY